MKTPLARLAGLVAIALTSVAAVAEYRAWSRVEERLLEVLDRHGVSRRSPELAHDVRRSLDPVRAKLRAARGLVADELDGSWRAELAGDELAAARRAGLEKLAFAREIASDGLAKRPASWQAATVLGAADYLESSRLGRPLSADGRRWESLLELARRRGPGQAEPLRFLGAAYLSAWPRLPDDERGEVVELLRQALRDPRTFDLLIDQWLRRAPSWHAAREILPDHPETWRRLQAIFAGRRDWERYVEARSAWYGALARDLSHRLAEAETRLAGGDAHSARGLASAVLEAAPPAARFAPLALRAVELLPAGPGRRPAPRHARDWLDWTLDRCLLGPCPFHETAIRRLGSMARLAEDSELATAAVVAGDLARAERIELRAAATRSDDWADYWVHKALAVWRQGRPSAAAPLLAGVPADARERAAVRLATARIAGDGERRTAARQWPATAWESHRGGARLGLVVDGRCRQMEIRFARVPEYGAAVEVHWDGELVGPFAVYPGSRLVLEVENPAPLHLLDVIRLQETTQPGPVRASSCAAG